MTEPSQRNRYSRIIEHIFLARYQEGANEVEFRREEFEQVAQKLGLRLPKNLGDIVYSLRYRTPLPLSITEKAPRLYVGYPTSRSSTLQVGDDS